MCLGLTPGPSHCERGQNGVGPSRYFFPYPCLLERCVWGRYWPARRVVCRCWGASCDSKHNNPDSLDARLFPSVVLADAPAVAIKKIFSVDATAICCVCGRGKLHTRNIETQPSHWRTCKQYYTRFSATPKGNLLGRVCAKCALRHATHR